jgi:PAS domain S-box-containing protein
LASHPLENRTGILLILAVSGLLLTAAVPLWLYPQVLAGNTLCLFLLACGLSLAALPLFLLRHRSHRNQQLRRDCARLAAENENLRLAQAVAERRSRQLLDNAGDAIFFIDPENGSLLELNRQAEELLGYKATEIHALSLSVLFPGHQHRRYLRLVRNVLDNGYGEDDNLLFRRKDGELFIGAVHARLGELGASKVVHGVLRNITEIKRIERELRQKNQDLTLVNEIARQVSGNRDLKVMLREVLARTVQASSAAGGGVYLANDDGNSLQLTVHQGIAEPLLADLEHITAGAGIAGRVAATGQARSSADLQKDRRLRSQAALAAGWRAFQAVPLVAGGSTLGVLFLFSLERRIMRREELNLLLSIGRQVGTAVQSAQLFESLQWQYRLTRASNRELKQSRRKLEENLSRLEETNRELERLDRMKSNFLAMASHELRTPLTYVLSGAELLKSSLAGRLSAEEERVADAIRQGGKRLDGIVQDLLEAARIESQSLYLAREPVDLPAIIAEVGISFRPVFEQRGLVYRMLDFPSPIELCGDTHHLRKTFQRLLENAVKFTPEGGEIEIGARLRTAAELKPHEPTLCPFSASFFRNLTAAQLLQVTVRDSGVGIDPEEQPRVFDRFYEIGRIAEHFTSQTRFGGKGVGLGLSLVKGMVEAHGGMVWVESAGTTGGTRGAGGSAFHVLLPLATATGEAGDAAG